MAFTRKIDWERIYQSYLSSGLTKEKFFSSKFRALCPEGIVSAKATFFQLMQLLDNRDSFQTQRTIVDDEIDNTNTVSVIELTQEQCEMLNIESQPSSSTSRSRTDSQQPPKASSNIEVFLPGGVRMLVANDGSAATTIVKISRMLEDARIGDVV